jgi:hypothetical protein
MTKNDQYPVVHLEIENFVSLVQDDLEDDKGVADMVESSNELVKLDDISHMMALNHLLFRNTNLFMNSLTKEEGIQSLYKVINVCNNILTLSFNVKPSDVKNAIKEINGRNGRHFKKKLCMIKKT